MHHKLVVVEGIDNVGKTTSAWLLAQQLTENGTPAVYYKTPPAKFLEATKLVNASSSRDTHFLYHAAMVKYAEREIVDLLKETSVVCDRWFYSTYAYHVAAGSKLQLHWDSLMEMKPDHVFLLLVRDEAERMRRAKKKGVNVEKYDLVTKEDALLLVRAESILEAAGLEHIDTTNLSLEAVVGIMFQKVQQLR